MAISKEKKVEILNKLKQAVKEAKSLVFVNFHGLKVSDETALRRSLSDENIGYTVAKKTLIGKALDDLDLTGQRPILDGEIAMAYGDDLLTPVKGVYEFNQKTDQLEIVGGIFEGEYMDKEKMMALALIPSQQTLYAQLANVINSPIQGLVIALNAIAESKEQA